MKHIQFLGALALCGCFTVSCANRNKVASNPYQSNPYYTGTSSAPSSAEAGPAEYPTYNDSAPSYDSANTVEYPTYSNEPEYPTYTSPQPPIEAPAPIPEPVSNTYSPPTYNTPTYDTPTYNTPSYSAAPNTAAARTHVVAKGENLYRISLKYGTSVSAIQSANGLGDSTIFPGQVLQIP